MSLTFTAEPPMPTPIFFLLPGMSRSFPTKFLAPWFDTTKSFRSLRIPKLILFIGKISVPVVLSLFSVFQKKLLIADLLATIVSPLVTNMAASSNLEAILAMIAYSMQLYFDFSGYSDMAVGLGLMMNIQFPQNFNSPYKALSITEFWQRWHISLSTWLRDYLYISLGGNRRGRWTTYRNLLLTMAIGGLWHGGSWTFALWGLFHGILLVIEKFFREKKWQLLRFKSLKLLATFFLVNIGWIFFRSPNFKTIGIWFQKIFLFNSEKLTWDLISLPERFKDRFFASLIIGLLLTFLAKNTWEIRFKPSTLNAALLGILFALCLMFMGDESPFLYFQF